MVTQRRWKLPAFTVMLAGIALSGVLVYDRLGMQRLGGNPMSDSRFTVEHVRMTTDKPFEEVAQGFERHLGRFDPDVYKSLSAGGDHEAVRAKLDTMAGPSGFMLFATHNHGALLRLAGRRRKAVQYVVGNPLFALQMTQHDIRASLYAPLRVLIYENEEGKTCVEYDKPSSLFGQFGNDGIGPTAAMLDNKLVWDRMLKAIEAGRFPERLTAEPPYRTVVTVDGEDVSIALREKTTRRKHVPTPEERARMRTCKVFHRVPAWDFIPTGKLVLAIDCLSEGNRPVNGVTWADTDRKRRGPHCILR